MTRICHFICFLLCCFREYSGLFCVKAYNAYVAIGPHKTGSTGVQAALCHYKSEIQRQLNVTVMLFNNKQSACEKSGALIVSNYQDKGEKQETDDHSIIMDQIEDTIKKCESDVFLASENFDRLSPDDIYRFRKDLDCYDNVFIIGFHRSRLEQIVSVWKQYEKFMKSTINETEVLPYLGFNQFYGLAVRSLGDNNYAAFKTNDILENWMKAFSYESMRILSFEGAVENFEDDPDAIFLATLKAVGLGGFVRPSNSTFYINRNVSPSMKFFDAFTTVRNFLALQYGLNQTQLLKLTFRNKKIVDLVGLIETLPFTTSEYLPTQAMVQGDNAIYRGEVGAYFYPVSNISLYNRPVRLEQLCIKCISISSSAHQLWKRIINSTLDALN